MGLKILMGLGLDWIHFYGFYKQDIDPIIATEFLELKETKELVKRTERERLIGCLKVKSS